MHSDSLLNIFSKSVQNIVIHYIFGSESLCVVNSLQIVNSLRVLFLVCRGPLGRRMTNRKNPRENRESLRKRKKYTSGRASPSRETPPFQAPLHCPLRSSDTWLKVDCRPCLLNNFCAPLLFRICLAFLSGDPLPAHPRKPAPEGCGSSSGQSRFEVTQTGVLGKDTTPEGEGWRGGQNKGGPKSGQSCWLRHASLCCLTTITRCLGNCSREVMGVSFSCSICSDYLRLLVMDVRTEMLVFPCLSA